MKKLFIVNPNAGKIDSTEMIRQEATKALGESFELIVSKNRQDLTDIARLYSHKDEKYLIFACGGDGTLSAVAAGMIKTDSILAPLPVGSGNDFIKYFGKDNKDKYTIGNLINGSVQRIDTLSINDLISINIVSAGFDAEVCAKMPIYKRIPLVTGPLAYDMALVHGFFTSIKNTYTLIVDGKEIPKNDYLFAVAANGHYYGGGFLASPKSDIADGYIDLILIPTLKRTKMATMVGDYKNGKHLDGRYPFIKHIKCKSVQYINDKKINLNVDGEMFLLDNPIVKIIEESLNIMVPKDI